MTCSPVLNVMLVGSHEHKDALARVANPPAKCRSVLLAASLLLARVVPIHKRLRHARHSFEWIRDPLLTGIHVPR